MERMKRNTVVGYSLIIAGLVLIALSVYLMYTVFTGSMEPPSIFSMSDIKMSGPPPAPGAPPTEIVLLPGEEVNKIINRVLWSILMFFVISAGTRIGGLGVKLVREIKVEVKRED